MREPSIDELDLISTRRGRLDLGSEDETRAGGVPDHNLVACQGLPSNPLLENLVSANANVNGSFMLIDYQSSHD